MSPRLVAILALAVIVAGVGAVTWIVIQPGPVPMSGMGGVSTQPASETERRDYREKFFDGDPDRDISGGQEMKPQW